MFATSHILLLKIDLSERASKYSGIVSIPPREGYWGTHTVYIVYYTIYSIVYYILLALLRKRNMF